MLIKYNIRLLEKLQKAKDHNLIWAFGGRLQERMKNAVLEAFIYREWDFFKIAIIASCQKQNSKMNKLERLISEIYEKTMNNKDVSTTHIFSAC